MSKIIKLSDRVNLQSHSNDDYTNAIKNFAEYIEGRNLKLSKEWDSLDLAVAIWNCWNLEQTLSPESKAKGIPYVSFFDFKQMTEVKELVKYRVDNYGTLDKFLIADLPESIDDLSGDFFPEIKAVDFDTFMSDNDDDDLDEEMMPSFEDLFGDIDYDDDEPRLLDREAIMVLPKQALFDWIVGLGNDDFTFEELSPQVFLVDDLIDDVKLWMKKNHQFISNEVFGAWTDDEELWPKKRTLSELYKYVEIKHAMTVIDLKDPDFL